MTIHIPITGTNDSFIFKILIPSILFFLAVPVWAQKNPWVKIVDNKESIITTKAVSRQSFPKDFLLYELDTDIIRQQLFSITDLNSLTPVMIYIPTHSGKMEQFEMFEASNFESA